MSSNNKVFNLVLNHILNSGKDSADQYIKNLNLDKTMGENEKIKNSLEKILEQAYLTAYCDGATEGVKTYETIISEFTRTNR